jgi:flagellar biosynthesis chaperone FliJ
MQSPANKNNLRLVTKFVTITFLLAWLVAVGILFVNKQKILDWWRLRGYSPPSAISRLADQDTMNSYTRHLFYLNRPQLLPTVTSFRASCPEDKGTIVLGCYHPDQNGIYIFNVADPTLAGVAQVTAAHEVLHAVYARLTNVQRTTLDKELQDFNDHHLQSAVVKAEVKLYKETEPSAVYDEMSCTFGTEIANLTPALENYYKNYFNNRSAIVAYEQKYESAFSSRQDQIKQYDSELAGMKTQIDAQQAGINTTQNILDTMRQNLNSYKSSGDYADYNVGVPEYNAQVDKYNSQSADLTSLINSYNNVVAERNNIAGQYTTLANAIDTRVTPQVKATN